VICPFCSRDRDKVVDSRSASGGTVIRRRRQCLECGKRFTTYEQIEEMPLRVIKKDGRRVPFNRMNILNGMLKACEKRPISIDVLDEIVSRIEQKVNQVFDREVPTNFIGEQVMDELKKVDEVAYVRFASVYREFKDINEFMSELEPMLEQSRINKSGRKIKNNS
jgi:transcriptional repressor NrdR